MVRSVGSWYRRGRGVPVGEGRVAFRDVRRGVHDGDHKLVVVPEKAGAVRTAPRHVHLDRTSLMRLRTESRTLQRGY
jgi:hypothetical protein